MLRRLLLTGSVALLALALVACGGDDDADATPTPDTDPDGTPTAAAPAPADDNGAAPGAENDVDDIDDIEPFAFAEGEDVFDVIGVSSFRQTWSVTVSGPGVAGTEADGTMEMESAFVQDPPASHVRLTDASGAVMMEIIRIQDTAWFGGGGMPWQQVDQLPFDPQDMIALAMLMAPDMLTTELGAFERVGQEDLHGRTATHYRIDRDAMLVLLEDDPEFAAADVSEAQVDYWVDETGRFILRYEMVVEGVDLDLAEDTGGESTRMEISFQLYDFDADISIEPPN